MAASKDVRKTIGSEPRRRLTRKISEKRAPSGEAGKAQDVPQADVAAEREIADRAGNQREPAAPQEKKDR